MAETLTQAQAVALAGTDWWKSMAPRDVVLFQLWEPRLCMNFGDFQMAVEHALGRPVWTHEFAEPERLQAEFLGDEPRPTFEQIVAKLPDHARALIVTTGTTDHG